MTDPIVVRGHRKSVLRRRFREIQREHGAGAIVAFTNGRAPHVQECLRGLLETGSITEPVYSDEGFAVVKIVQDPEQRTMSDPPAGEIHQENVAGETIVDTATDTPDPDVTRGDTDSAPPPTSGSGPEIPDQIKDAEPPPTSGPGSGADAWRTYAATATGTAFTEWSKMGRDAIVDHLRANGVRTE